MGMTMTQKILAAHAGLDTVEAGQLIEAKLDIVMANDITGPMALPIIRQMSDKVFDKDKVVFVPDHFTPNKDIKSAENSKAIREYAKEQGLKWYFEQGKSGVEHAIFPKRELSPQVSVSSERIHIHVHTELWARFQQEWERPMWQPEWRQEKSGLKCRRRSSLF